MEDTGKAVQDYILVRTGSDGLVTHLLESTDPAAVERAFKDCSLLLTTGGRLDVVKRSQEIMYSAVGVSADEIALSPGA